MDLSVLSAETYYDRQATDEGRDVVADKSLPAVFFGGIVPSDDTDLDSSPNGGLEDSPMPVLRTRENLGNLGQGIEDEVDSKKRRGRPRIHTRDETASNVLHPS